jgi:exosortase A-associated hydrolase 1
VHGAVAVDRGRADGGRWRMSFTEHVATMQCKGEVLLGVVSRPERASKLGVIVVVGGPQYRVGSHRQFVLLARCLASAGYPVLRFDYRGMGDSGGTVQSFDAVEDDIAAAIDALQAACPEVERVALWGLCDGATASALYCDATHDARIAGLCLLNPWVRSDATLARTHLKHYYGSRLLQGAFWRKLLIGEFDWMRAIKGLWGNLQASRGYTKTELRAKPFQNRMASALRHFSGKVLLILSANDFTAKEFVELASSDPLWRGILERPDLQKIEIEGADHTFSKQPWRSAAEQAVLKWMTNLKEAA